ncbi:MAG: endonuclease III [Candidatus Micrarchaeota archaeon]
MKRLRDKMVRVCLLLGRRFGESAAGIAPAGSALDILVATILSQNASDRNSVPAFRALKRRFPKWERVLSANEKEIARTIRGAGLANLKARRVKHVLAEVKRRQGRLELSFLQSMPTAQAKDYLLSFKGIGPKTAAVVLNFGFGKPTMPLDVHNLRVLKRLGILRENTGAEKAHGLMDEVVPDDRKSACHVNLIRLGRRVCRPRNPKCLECPLNAECVYFRRQFRRNRA